MLGLLAAAFGFYLVVTGSIPVGRFPSFFSSTADLGSTMVHIAGGMILAGLFLPEVILEGWYGEIVLLVGALVVLFVGIIASLTGRAR